MKYVTLLKRENNSLRWKCLESAWIANSATVNIRPGTYNVSSFFKDLLSQCRIFNNNVNGNIYINVGILKCYTNYIYA